MGEKTKVIYVCAPLSADIVGSVEENIEKAMTYARRVAEIGYVPVTPHSNFKGLFDDTNPHERETAMMMCQKLLAKCDEVWVFGNFISGGMDTEIWFAKILDIPVMYVRD